MLHRIATASLGFLLVLSLGSFAPPQACGTSAAVSPPLGGGCGAILGSTPPVLGSSAVFNVVGAPLFGFALFYASAPLPAPFSYEGCLIYVNPATAVLLGTQTLNQQGSGAKAVAIPNDSALCGGVVALQTVVIGQQPLFFGAISNGLYLTLGS